MIVDVSEFLSLRKQLPVVDVRSEGEYLGGHVPGAINIPLLNNTERIAVGTDYKKKGQQEAIKTGFRLVGPRLSSIIDHASGVGNELIVYCWRGGMRSSNFCQFAGMARIKTHQLAGGYKAFRHQALNIFKKPHQLMLIGGCTGSGKSDILRELANQGEQVIDLEKLANHKGSAFGGLMQLPQPTTEQFHNNLFEELLKLDDSRRVWIEDESLAVGKTILPLDLWSQMRSSPVIELVVEKEIRIERLVAEYGQANTGEFLQAMVKITKKLGGQHFNTAKQKLLAGEMGSTIDILLSYYDKAYIKGLDERRARIKLQSQWNGRDIDQYVQRLVNEVNAVSTRD